MKNMRNGYYKIGRSSKPLTREKTLQAEEPEVKLVASIDAPDTLERELHNEFERFRIRGEWFNFYYPQLFALRDIFGTDVECLAAPSETQDILHGTHVLEVCRFGGGTVSSRIRGKHIKKLKLEVPYLITDVDAEREYSAESSFLEFELNNRWDEFFWSRFSRTDAEIIICANDHKINRCQIYCPLEERKIGVEIADPILGTRLYLNESGDDAEVYFERCRRTAKEHWRIGSEYA